MVTHTISFVLFSYFLNVIAAFRLSLAGTKLPIRMTINVTLVVPIKILVNKGVTWRLVLFRKQFSYYRVICPKYRLRHFW